MKQINILLTSLVILKLVNGVVITPTSTDDYVTVSMAVDTRTNPTYVNGIVDNKFQLNDGLYNPFLKWGLVLDADSIEYGFKAGQVSSLSITIAGNTLDNGDNDAFLAFSFGDEKYLTFVTDVDSGGFNVNWQNSNTGRYGIFIYPGNQLATGDPSTIYDGVTVSSGDSGGAIRSAMAGGDYTQWATFSSSQNQNNFPLVFTIENDDSAGTLSLTFNGVTRTYNEPAPILKNFKLYMSADVNQDTDGEVFQISSITITGTNTGYTLAPTPQPTLDGCDFDIDAYLSQCYCTDTSSAKGSPFNGDEFDNNNMNKYYGGYDNNKYPEYNPIPNSNPNPIPVSYPESHVVFIAYLSLIMNFVIFGYMFYLNGCGPKKSKK